LLFGDINQSAAGSRTTGLGMEVEMSNPFLNLVQLRKRAKERRASGEFATLAEAQLAVAREAGFASWPKLKLHCEQRELRGLIESGDVEGLRALLARSPRVAAAPLDDGAWPLHLAAGSDEPEMVELLVKSGAAKRPRYAKSAHTALSWAVTCWSFRAAMKLIELGDEPDLFCAAGLGLLDKVQAFWRDGVLRPAPSITGSSRMSDSGERLTCPPPDDRDQVSDALYIACRCGRVQVAQWLLVHGADANWRGYCGASCLAWAEFAAIPELSAMLRAHGGRDDLLDQVYRATPSIFPLMVLAGWGFHPDQLRARFSANPSLAHVRSEWGSLLHAAAQGGHVGVLKLLLEYGVDRSQLNARGQTAAELAEHHGHSAAAALLRA